VTDALVDRGALVEEADRFAAGPALEETIELLGLQLSPSRRPLVLRCVDWSERRPHVAGALGAAIASHALASGWVERRPGSRALGLTAHGAHALESLLGVVPAPAGSR